MDDTFDRLFEDVDECNRQTLEEYLDLLICENVPEESMVMLTICPKFRTGQFTVDWLIDFLFKIIHERYVIFHDEDGDPELLEAGLHRDLFSNVVKWGGCSFSGYKCFFYEPRIGKKMAHYRKFGRIVHVLHDDVIGENGEGDGGDGGDGGGMQTGSNNDDNSETVSLADRIRSLGDPIRASNFDDNKFMIVEVNMRPVDGIDDSRYVQENQSMMRELDAIVTYAYMRRRLAWKRWALVRGEFYKQILGHIVSYWIHETNKPDSRAFKRARTSFYSAV